MSSSECQPEDDEPQHATLPAPGPALDAVLRAISSEAGGCAVRAACKGLQGDFDRVAKRLVVGNPDDKHGGAWARRQRARQQGKEEKTPGFHWDGHEGDLPKPEREALLGLIRRCRGVEDLSFVGRHDKPEVVTWEEVLQVSCHSSLSSW